jgi:sialic acid synthase SpsE/quercetin dioxygenase-like cupin family protein
MFFIFEMANNHMGSVEHGKLLIETFGKLAKKYGINAGMKLQFRNLPTFIHKDFKNSDLKYVKRFNETALTESQFKILLDWVVFNELKTVVTPFDNESLPMIDRLGVDVVKIASCSIDDWPLLEEISEINKKIIISTGGADFDTLRKVYRLFKSKGRDFAFMHCVAEYSTPHSHANLQRIRDLKYEFSDIQVGLSTHEPPTEKSIVPLALAMGCEIVEKHIAIPNVEEGWKPNEYSCTPEQIEDLFKEIVATQKSIDGKSDDEIEALASLKRGVYVKRDLEKGQLLTSDDLYYSMPLQEGQLDASNYYDIVGSETTINLTKDKPLNESDIIQDEVIMGRVKTKVLSLLEKANVTITPDDEVEISSHYGLEKFEEVGCLIINKINREYCKKIIVQLPNQKHPSHYHIKKEETFELLYGDCELNLNSKDIELEIGKPILINRGVNHSFSSKGGCVIEEVSTTHYLNDSKYENVEINSLELNARKVYIKLIG